MWTDLRFRSTALLELRRLDELTPEQKELFRELEDDDDFYGLLVPRPGVALNVKSVGHQTAELFRDLATPRRFDAGVLADDEYRNDLVDLVLDAVLEIESGDGFVTGADAFPVFYPAGDATVTTSGGGAIARLSREALEHAEDLATADATALTNALYAYNRIPITPFWLSRFANRDAVLAHLGADTGSLKSLLERYWIISDADPEAYWIGWRARAHTHIPRDSPTFKLYVSPRPERIRDAFHALVRVLADIPGASFKIGPDATGLLRPDKLVSYFSTRETLDVAARALQNELAGCPAHGIPFSAGIDDDGLLSWGIDPPDSERVLSWRQRESWRLWVAMRLGSALSIAKRATSRAVEPWRFAVERVRRHGVDVDTWTPTTIWRAGA
jgi:hypothetical protein